MAIRPKTFKLKRLVMTTNKFLMGLFVGSIIIFVVCAHLTVLGYYQGIYVGKQIAIERLTMTWFFITVSLAGLLGYRGAFSNDSH